MAIKVASYSQMEDIIPITKAMKPIIPIPIMNGIVSWTLKAQIDKTTPVADNKTAKGRAQSRRVEMTLSNY